MFHVEHVVNTYSFQEVEEVQGLARKSSERLSKYVDQLLWWNKRVNLVSRDVSRETLMLHVEHSIALSVSSLFQKASRIIDAGSGGGLPGVPLGIIHPKKEIILNDIVSKKMMACKQMISKLELNNEWVEMGSIAELERKESDLVISKHAFKVNDLIGFLDHKGWTGIVLLKGAEEIEQELEGLKVPLKIDIYSLEAFGNSFYDGKAMVEITKREDE